MFMIIYVYLLFIFTVCKARGRKNSMYPLGLNEHRIPYVSEHCVMRTHTTEARGRRRLRVSRGIHYNFETARRGVGD